jgi:NADH-quinone oxidoreductase subunit M
VAAAHLEKAALLVGRLSAGVTLAFWLVLWLLAENGVPSSRGADIALLAPFSPALRLRLEGAGITLSGMVALIASMALVAGASSAETGNRRQTVVVLLLEAGLIGLAASQNLVSFLIFWELALLPLLRLVEAPLGGELVRRLMVTSLLTSAFLWLGAVEVSVAAGASLNADFSELRAGLGDGFSAWRLWWFLPAFLFRLAAVPLHTWLGRLLSFLPPAPGMMLLGGVLPVTVLGLERVVLGIAGGQAGALRPWLLWLGVGTVLTGGFSALAQGELKKLLAYICLAHGGLLLAALGAGGGGQYLWLAATAAGISGAALALFASVICRARQSQRLVEISGLWRSHPFFAGLSFAAVASLAVVPGTAGFSGALGLLRAMSPEPPAACLAAGGLVLCGLAGLWAYRFILGGSYLPNLWIEGRWPTAAQVMVLFLFALLLVLLGVAPGALPLAPGGVL